MNKIDSSALFNIGYGLYLATVNDGKKDNALILNAVCQQTVTPLTVTVTVNKQNFSCEIIKNTKILNICCLTEDTPFAIFERFGFQSGKTVDKFSDLSIRRSENGLCYLTCFINSVISLKVTDSIDLGTHIMFLCEVTECFNLSDKKTMSYSYYFDNVKPKPQEKGYVCKICGYVYKGDSLPDDYICPICKHPASDFEKSE